MSDATQVHNDRFDTVALSFNLGLNAFHFIPVEGVGDIATDVDGGHGCRFDVDLTEKIAEGDESLN